MWLRWSSECTRTTPETLWPFGLSSWVTVRHRAGGFTGLNRKPVWHGSRRTIWQRVNEAEEAGVWTGGQVRWGRRGAELLPCFCPTDRKLHFGLFLFQMLDRLSFRTLIFHRAVLLLFISFASRQLTVFDLRPSEWARCTKTHAGYLESTNNRRSLARPPGCRAVGSIPKTSTKKESLITSVRLPLSKALSHVSSSMRQHR